MGAPAIKPFEEWSRTSVTLPRRVWDKIDKTLESVNDERPKPERYSRDKFMAELLDWACDEIKKERASAKRSS